MELNWSKTCIMDIALCLLGITMFIQMVAGDGIVRIRFLRYRNPGGLGSNGHCCDGKWSMCSSDCDHKFTVCLDKKEGGPSIDSCYYGAYVSTRIKNENENVFGNRIGGLSNPLVFRIKGRINMLAALKIRVEDCDGGLFSGGDDHVDDLQADIYVHKGPFNEVMLPVTMHARTTMESHITVSCEDDWYEEDCSVYCKPSKQDNYYCDAWSGEKICHPGWIGINCDIPEGNDTI